MQQGSSAAALAHFSIYTVVLLAGRLSRFWGLALGSCDFALLGGEPCFVLT